jgi:hypothetical protein
MFFWTGCYRYLLSVFTIFVSIYTICQYLQYLLKYLNYKYLLIADSTALAFAPLLSKVRASLAQRAPLDNDL